jgi:hypothetical protein
MAKKTVVLLEDDIDGSEATGTLSFALDGSDYEIDLNEGHAKELREGLTRLPTPDAKYPAPGAVPQLVPSPPMEARTQKRYGCGRLKKASW